MNTTTCPKCNGTGRYDAPTCYGPSCFACKGTGRVTLRPAKSTPVVLSAMRNIADICAGDPTLVDLGNARMLQYLGLSEADLLRYRELWAAGIRQVAR